MSFALSFQKPAKPCGKTERKLRETLNFGEMCVKSTQSKRVRKRSDEKSTCEVVENSDLSTAKSTGCGKVEISTRVFNRVWKTRVDNLHLPKITALEKAVGNFRERLQSFFSKKERSNFLFLRLLAHSKKLHLGKSHLRFK